LKRIIAQRYRVSANRSNSIGVKGIAQDVKIMPIVISYSGDEHDKDIAMAIYYAVDNGAKVNMSFEKNFLCIKKWVIDAYKYAEKHNVLLVHAAGIIVLMLMKTTLSKWDNMKTR
jgi:subtilisin family serine protease